MTELEERLRAAVLDRYALERELGRGGMAVVFLARDRRHDRAVAIKVLRDEIAAALGAERFLREIQIAAKLHHPHILPLYDSGAVADLLYYVMPYVEGESLRERLDRETQLPLDDALTITRQVAGALAYAHRHDVVHRDIKPENILLESGEAVVADFGIARAITAAGGDTLTQTGIAIGTPPYMSPEQAAGGGALDGRSDVYSLACVLYEMLAGHPPFVGGTAQASSLVTRWIPSHPFVQRGARCREPSNRRWIVRSRSHRRTATPRPSRSPRPWAARRPRRRRAVARRLAGRASRGPSAWSWRRSASVSCSGGRGATRRRPPSAPLCTLPRWPCCHSRPSAGDEKTSTSATA